MYPCREVLALAVNREVLALAVEAVPAVRAGRAAAAAASGTVRPTESMRHPATFQNRGWFRAILPVS